MELYLLILSIFYLVFFILILVGYHQEKQKRQDIEPLPIWSAIAFLAALSYVVYYFIS